MEKLSAAFGMPLVWVQPKILERFYELRSETGLFGCLQFKSSFGTLAEAEAAAGRWSFKRVGFLNPRVTVREAGAESDLAVYWPKFWGDGWLEFATGVRFHWKSTSFWGASWGFANAQEQLLFVLKPGVEHAKLADLFKNQATVEVEPQAGLQHELPLLMLLAWYLMILHQEDSAVVASTAAAS